MALLLVAVNMISTFGVFVPTASAAGPTWHMFTSGNIVHDEDSAAALKENGVINFTLDESYNLAQYTKFKIAFDYQNVDMGETEFRYGWYVHGEAVSDTFTTVDTISVPNDNEIRHYDGPAFAIGDATQIKVELQHGSADAGGSTRPFEVPQHIAISNFALYGTFDAPLDAPQLVSPADTSEVATTIPTLVWGEVEGATDYRVEVASDALFATILESTEVTKTSHTVSGDAALKDGETYYWRVQAYNSEDESDWSDVHSFSIKVVTTDNPGKGGSDDEDIDADEETSPTPTQPEIIEDDFARFLAMNYNTYAQQGQGGDVLGGDSDDQTDEEIDATEDEESEEVVEDKPFLFLGWWWIPLLIAAGGISYYYYFRNYSDR